jgi:hypothetical protein
VIGLAGAAYPVDAMADPLEPPVIEETREGGRTGAPSSWREHRLAALAPDWRVLQHQRDSLARQRGGLER